MFKRKPEEQPVIRLDRVKAIAALTAPAEYVESGTRGSRRTARETVYKQGRVETLHGEKLNVVIKNLNATGCRIEYMRQGPLEGRLLVTELSVPLRFWADVVWQGEGCSGLRIVKDETKSG